MSRPAIVLQALLLSGALCAQQPAVPPQAAVAAPASPAMVYRQRPLRVPVSCRAADFEASGVDCTEDEPCRVFLELTAVDVAGPKVVLTGNLHTSSTTISSLALLSEDSGTTWREPIKREPATGFEGVQLLDAQTGWVAAQPQAQFAADPYFLATSDGGNSWRKMPVWAEEGRAGLIQQFQFDGKNHGFVLIDRSQSASGADKYQLYETMTGASSWMLRGVSDKPIKPTWQPRRSSGWRLRVDEKAATYELERQVGGLWQRMANFRTELGVCKSLESDSPPPIAPPDAPRDAPPAATP